VVLAIDPWPLTPGRYFRPFFPAFFGFAFFDGADFCPGDFPPPRFPANAESQPSAYFEFVPTRVIVTARSS
jgi:hypothetical protein